MATDSVTAAPASLWLAAAQCVTADLPSQMQLPAQRVMLASHHSLPVEQASLKCGMRRGKVNQMEQENLVGDLAYLPDTGKI